MFRFSTSSGVFRHLRKQRCTVLKSTTAPPVEEVVVVEDVVVVEEEEDKPLKQENSSYLYIEDTVYVDHRHTHTPFRLVGMQRISGIWL